MRLGDITNTFIVCRFMPPVRPEEQTTRIGVVTEANKIIDLKSIETITDLIRMEDPLKCLRNFDIGNATAYELDGTTILCPIGDQKVWGAGVTYNSSAREREVESGNPGFYAMVYNASRPELFSKCDGDNPFYTRGPNQEICIPSYSNVTVPEPELVFVISPKGEIVGYTIGNDVTATDIEGENPLYLPQAKTFRGCFSCGPFMVLGLSEEEIREQTIRLTIKRSNGSVAFSGETKIGEMKRTFQELVKYLFENRSFNNGVALSTGTGIVTVDANGVKIPLLDGDTVEIEIPAIGTLTNQVKKLVPNDW